jgi:hypothetical protein
MSAVDVLRIVDIARDCELNLVTADMAARNGDHDMAAECLRDAAEDSAAAFALAGGAK